MNLSLFKSLWAIIALLCAGAFVSWMVGVQAPPGSREHVALQLTSGWITFTLMIVVCFYSLRKFIHKLGWSPEFKMRVDLDSMERANAEMNVLRAKVRAGLFSSKSEVESEASEVLQREGCARICKAEVTESRKGAPYVIDIRPTEPLGRVSRWLHFHAYVGLASGVILFVHGGMSFGSTMGILLNGLSLLIIVTGILGMTLFALGPRWMTKAEKDMNFEESYVLDESLKEKIKEAYKALPPEQVRYFKSAAKTTESVEVQRTSLMKIVNLEPESEKELQDVMVLVAQRRKIREDLQGAMRVRWLINSWRLVHIPATILLLATTLLHVWSVIWY